MKNVFWIILVIIFMAMCSRNCGDGEKNIANKQKLTTKEWYEGGTLHKKTMREWKAATYENKLATCADFIVAGKNLKDMNKVYLEASDLVKALDASCKNGDIMDEQPVSRTAATLILMLDN
jgi:hypothetical protein